MQELTTPHAFVWIAAVTISTTVPAIDRPAPIPCDTELKISSPSVYFLLNFAKMNLQKIICTNIINHSYTYSR